MSADNLITWSLVKQGMQVVADSLKKETEKQVKQIKDFQQSVAANTTPPLPPPRNQTVNELKTTLMD